MNREEYNVANGVLFETSEGKKYHSFQDFGLITASIKVPPAQPKTEYLEIPFRNGSIDVSEINGVPITYQDRTITMLFIVPPPASRVEELRSEIENKINGRTISKLILDNDIEWHYIGGRAVVTSYTDVYPHKIEVQVQVYPYKKKNEARKISLNIAPVATQKVLRLTNYGSRKVRPTFQITVGNMDITFNNTTVHLTEAGTYNLDYRFELDYGANYFIIETPAQTAETSETPLNTSFFITYTEESL